MVERASPLQKRDDAIQLGKLILESTRLPRHSNSQLNNFRTTHNFHFSPWKARKSSLNCAIFSLTHPSSQCGPEFELYLKLFIKFTSSPLPATARSSFFLIWEKKLSQWFCPKTHLTFTSFSIWSLLNRPDANPSVRYTIGWLFKWWLPKYSRLDKLLRKGFVLLLTFLKKW